MKVNSCGFFTATCTGLQEMSCAEQINDIVTVKFTKKFPVNKFQISLVMLQTSNGITAARVSIAPVLGDEIGYTTIGTKAWLVTHIAEDTTRTGLIKSQVVAIRSATQGMMNECEKTLDCNIYSNK
ncbi:hypothetical protein [Polynucleobacter sp. Fuers-14]|uniref:hypothetical protein n=1 Tax=Polynucleobacter sp. Fuers-14 TaxID=1758364 RepID=UPI001C0B4202|nr:hypothetical protein [Polynucleobacter sp. Fuers-14]MBU3642298.1 hypothetical protein [Polynucleobacter sp. Fuers-14]